MCEFLLGEQKRPTNRPAPRHHSQEVDPPSPFGSASCRRCSSCSLCRPAEPHGCPSEFAGRGFRRRPSTLTRTVLSSSQSSSTTTSSRLGSTAVVVCSKIRRRRPSFVEERFPTQLPIQHGASCVHPCRPGRRDPPRHFCRFGRIGGHRAAGEFRRSRSRCRRRSRSRTCRCRTSTPCRALERGSPLICRLIARPLKQQ